MRVACNQAEERVVEILEQCFPTVKPWNIQIKTIGFSTGNERNNLRSYVHNIQSSDVYTDGEVVHCKRGKTVLDFSRAFFIDRDSHGVPRNLTAVFRNKENRFSNVMDIMDHIDKMSFLMMI